MYTEEQLAGVQVEIDEMREDMQKTVEKAKVQGKPELAAKIQAVVDALSAFTPLEQLQLEDIDAKE